MPFSELFRMPKGKFDSTQDKNTTTCSSFVPENDFVDIVWQNGQISMSSRRTRKVPATRKYGKFGTMDCEFRTPGVSKETGSNEDDNMVPGFNRPIDESLQHGSCSDFISGVTANQVSSQNHVSSIGKTIRSNTGSVHNESIASFPSLRSKVQDSSCNNNMRHEKQDLVPPSTSSVSKNFPLFSLREYGVRPLGKDASAPEKVNLRPTEDVPVEEPVGTKRSEFTCQESASKPDLGKAVEPALACSSVCSGSSIERPSDGDTETRDLKRKSRDAEDSEWASEEESMDVRRAARSKRRRAAEVHNLSERVRRDRINDKMRALQELVPNCNKSDKASMLDEAIEYLKSLQLQVQMMSMGAGLYMPPMMMQHLHAASTGHLMGMGMNYGTGIPDMMGGSSACPMIQVSPMQGGPFPSPHMLGPSANLQLFDPPTIGLPMSFALSGRKDLMHNFNSQAMQNGGTNSSMNQTSKQYRTS